MSSAPATPDPAATPADAPKGGGMKLIIIGAVAGLVLGGGVGGFVIAPRMAPATAAAEEAPAADHEAGGGGGGDHGEGGGGATTVHTIENLVLNPANTNGQRFLLVTASIVGKDEAAVEELKARDAEVRDRIVDFLGAKTIEELTDPARRETLRTDLAAAIGGLFKEGSVKRVLLPQFVIQ